jgi:predicted acetyltransferase
LAPARPFVQEHAPAPPFGIVGRAYSRGQAESYILNTRIEKGSVSVTVAAAAQAPVIQNLMQLYTHDFSEFWGGTSRGDPNAEGLFAPYALDEYWTKPNWSAMLIWCDHVLAGFSLINDQTHSGLAANRNMAEFFILRKHRGRGVGRSAAEIIFSQHPGPWEVAVARKNSRALEFWNRTIRRSGKTSNLQELDLQNEHWNGPILRFEWVG